MDKSVADLAAAVALRARPAHGQEALLIMHLAFATADRALRQTVLGFGALSLAPTASLHPGYLDIGRHTLHHVFERNLQFERQVLAPLRPGPAAASASTEQISKSEELAQNIFKPRELAWVKSTGARCGALYTGMSVAVVSSALLRIA